MLILLQQLLNGLTTGTLFALIAIGYTMVYGIIELINFAHGDLFMLGSFLALTLASAMGLATTATPPSIWLIGLVSAPIYFVGSAMPPHVLRSRLPKPSSLAGIVTGLAAAAAYAVLLSVGIRLLGAPATGEPGSYHMILSVIFTFLVCMTFCGSLNFAQDRIVYRALRNAPKLTPLVSAIGVSFIFMGLGQIWKGVADINFPDILPNKNLLPSESLRFTAKDLLVILVTVPLMAGLTLFVRFTKLGKAMRATAQNPTAARLMGIDVDSVIGWTFGIGGLLAGAASVTYGLTINTVSFQMGYQNGLYAFTAAVLGGIGNLPGAMLGGVVIGLIRSLGSQYVGEQWTSALVFAILIILLVFRPSGLLGARTREKV
ncbi:MAG TPA: branched-chain amino acid ABC transporter permease [Planctomycetota bacterium]|nr:branched-chain amino acid ABC transporter permease [Planctomycetota bacterium]